MARRLAAACLMTVLPGAALAVDLDFNNANQDDFRGVAEDVSAGVAYRSVQPAETGGLLGFDVGGLASYTSIENDENWRNLTGEDPSGIGFIGLTANKGIPLIGVDVGGFLSIVPGTDLKLYGAEARYSFVSGNVAIPAMALRVGYSTATGEDDIEVDALSYDLSISKGFAFVTPYVGYGRVDSEVTSDVSGLDDEDFELDRFFGGVRLSLGVLRLTGEAETIGDNSAFNLRLTFGL